MNIPRVVVTGMGTVNPLANDAPSTWRAMLEGKSGIRRIQAFDPSSYRCQVAGEVKDFDFQHYYADAAIAKAKKMDPYIHYAQASTKEALAMAGYEINDPEKVGVCIGTGIGGLHTHERNTVVFAEKGHRRISPFFIPGTIANIVSGFISMQIGAKGPNFGVVSACATANHAVGVAFMMIRSGMATAMIAGGSESAITETGVGGFDNMRALTSGYNETPERASRPFDKGRDGFIIAEGAGVLLLEEYESAKARGADILCELAWVGMTADAHDLVAPHPEGEGALRSMKMALNLGQVNVEDLGYINAHATSTPVGDVAEAQAIMKLLDGNQGDVNVGSTKSMHGHLLGATSGVEAVAAIMALREGVIPPTINIDNFDEATGLTCVNTEVIERKFNAALSNSFGFGGHNSSLLVKKI